MRLPLRSEDTELRSALLQYNRTELYQTCRKAGIPVHPTASVEKMVDCLLGIDVPEARSHAIDEIRYAQMDFLREHRSTLGLQIRCPAQSMERTACFSCVDTQVLSCLLASGHKNAILQHRKHLPVIQLPPPKEYTMSNNITALSRAELTSSNLARRKVAAELGLAGEHSSQEQKKAWIGMTADAQVEHIMAEYARRGLLSGEAAAASAQVPTNAPAVTEVNPASLQAAQAAAQGTGGEAAPTRSPRTTTKAAKEAAAAAAPSGGDPAAITALMARLDTLETALVRIAEICSSQKAEADKTARIVRNLAALSYSTFADANRMSLPDVAATANDLGSDLADTLAGN